MRLKATLQSFSAAFLKLGPLNQNCGLLLDLLCLSLWIQGTEFALVLLKVGVYCPGWSPFKFIYVYKCFLWGGSGVGGGLCMCICTTCVLSTHKGQKSIRSLGTWALELWIL